MKPKWTFLPDVIKILNIINKIHDFQSYIQCITITIAEMISYVCLVEIEVLHMNSAGKVLKF